jgi:hypothetical protein
MKRQIIPAANSVRPVFRIFATLLALGGWGTLGMFLVLGLIQDLSVWTKLCGYTGLIFFSAVMSSVAILGRSVFHPER